MRYFLSVFILLFSVSVYAQTDSIFPSETGATLINSLQASYSVTNSLSYNAARDAMFEQIDKKEGNQITCVYTGYTITFTSRTDAQDNNDEPSDFNTEHTWPQSFFDSDAPMRADIHHLFPTRQDVNGARNNFSFAEISDQNTSTWYRENSNQSSVPTSNIDEYSELLSGTSFEPREDHKGNVARAMFYFWTIYQDNASIVNDGTDNEAFFEGMKDVLLTWHDLDPVDQAEVDRSLGAESAQGNRNPFVHDTTLVRRAYFGADGNPDPSLANPLSGELVNIQSDIFTINYVESGQNKTAQFNYDSSLETEDPNGDPFLMTDYETIAEASVNWQEDQTSASGRKATMVIVQDFGDSPPDTVIGSGSSSSLILTGVFDGTLSGGTPKGVELFAIDDIEDLGFYGIGSANNGGGSDGVEFMLTGSIAQGEFMYIATEEANFNVWFGFNPDLVDDMAVAINGNDAIELFFDSTKAFTGDEYVVDIFGEIDASPTSWSYANGWAYRNSSSGPDGNTFVQGNWMYSGDDAYDGASTNADAANSMPVKSFEPVNSISNDDDTFEIPTTSILSQNYPNPFNPSTVISYQLENSQTVTLAVYDQLGRRVALLVNGRRSNGSHQVTFDASGLSSGVYFYRLRTETSLLTKKMLLIK